MPAREIIASSTYPSFNANHRQDWPNLISRSDAPLLNRATQGLYPLGNLHALLALTASFEQNPSADPLEGINTRLDADCRIALQPVRHTAVKALQHGCQMASFELSEREEAAEILQTARNIGLFTQPSIAIETAPVSAEPDPELEQTQFIHALRAKGESAATCIMGCSHQQRRSNASTTAGMPTQPQWKLAALYCQQSPTYTDHEPCHGPQHSEHPPKGE